MSDEPDAGVDRKPAPENWEYVGEPEYATISGQRYKNDCGLWLVIEDDTVVTWVGNFHVAVRGTKEKIGRFEDSETAKKAAIEWMKNHPNPWEENYAE